MGPLSRSLVVLTSFLILIALPLAVLAEDGTEPFVRTSWGTEVIPTGVTWSHEIVEVPMTDDYHITLSIATEAGASVDVSLMNGDRKVLVSYHDVEVREFQWLVSPMDDVTYVTLVPATLPPSMDSVDVEWRLTVFESSALEDEAGGEDGERYWNNSSVLVLGLVGTSCAGALLMLALKPFRLEPSARTDLATVRQHQQKMR